MLPKLPPGTTEQELSDFFRSHFMNIPPECISVKEFEGNAGAFVSLQNAVIVNLFNWALAGDSLNGWPQTATLRKGRL